jgi:carbamoyl-phosphate synthase large subunit
MKNINILITAASRRVALVKNFVRAINQNGYTGKIIATDTDPLSPALYFTAKHYLAPLSTSPDYIPAIKDICKKEDINLVIPTIDEELPMFGRYKEEFKKEGITILISEEKTCRICNDKFETFKFFRERGLPFPDTFLPEGIDYSSLKYPLFIKPRFGRGSINAYPIANEKELRFFIEYIKEPVIQRFLGGKEYTIDVLCNMKGRILSVVPRERMVIRSGVCDRGRTVKDKKLIDYSVRVAEGLNIIGPANLQCKVDGDVVFFEVNPRFSGAIQLTIEAGADFPAMIIDMVNGSSPEPCIGDFKDGVIMTSYEDSIYI